MDELWDAIDAAKFAAFDETTERARELFGDAESLALRMLADNPTNAEACYALAIIWYERPLPPDDCREQVYHWLHQTEILEPEHPWVPLYLGYQHYDDGEHSQALEAFAQVDYAYFDSIDHHWRNLKTSELILCCQIKISGPHLPFEQLHRLVSEYVAADEVDRPAPSEIVQALRVPANRARFEAADRAICAEMIRLIKGTDSESAFPEEIEIFSDCSGSR